MEVHGHAFDLFCVGCGRELQAEVLFPEGGGKPELPPKCEACGGLIRPKVVLFGEMLPAQAVAKMLEIQNEGVDLVVSVGTSAVFPYIAEPVYRARSSGIPTMEINPSRSEISDLVSHRLPLGAAEALGRIWERMNVKKG